MNRAVARAACQALGNIGLGLALWMGLSTGLLLTSGGTLANLRGFQLAALTLALALSALALFSLPATATDALARTWKPRALVLLLVCLASTAALLGLLTATRGDPGFIAVAGLLASLSAVAAVGALAVAGNDGRQALGNLVPAQLALALHGGGAWLFALLAWRWSGSMQGGISLPGLLLALMAAITVATPWLGEGGLRGWNGQAARWSVLAGLLPLPLLLLALAWAWPAATRYGCGLAAIGISAALVLERLLDRAPEHLPGPLVPNAK